jgi:hypothetical protein
MAFLQKPSLPEEEDSNTVLEEVEPLLGPVEPAEFSLSENTLPTSEEQLSKGLTEERPQSEISLVPKTPSATDQLQKGLEEGYVGPREAPPVYLQDVVDSVSDAKDWLVDAVTPEPELLTRLGQAVLKIVPEVVEDFLNVGSALPWSPQAHIKRLMDGADAAKAAGQPVSTESLILALLDMANMFKGDKEGAVFDIDFNQKTGKIDFQLFPDEELGAGPDLVTGIGTIFVPGLTAARYVSKVGLARYTGEGAAKLARLVPPSVLEKGFFGSSRTIASNFRFRDSIPVTKLENISRHIGTSLGENINYGLGFAFANQLTYDAELPHFGAVIKATPFLDNIDMLHEISNYYDVAEDEGELAQRLGMLKGDLAMEALMSVFFEVAAQVFRSTRRLTEKGAYANWKLENTSHTAEVLLRREATQIARKQADAVHPVGGGVQWNYLKLDQKNQLVADVINNNPNLDKYNLLNGKRVTGSEISTMGTAEVEKFYQLQYEAIKVSSVKEAANVPEDTAILSSFKGNSDGTPIPFEDILSQVGDQIEKSLDFANRRMLDSAHPVKKKLSQLEGLSMNEADFEAAHKVWNEELTTLGKDRAKVLGIENPTEREIRTLGEIQALDKGLISPSVNPLILEKLTKSSVERADVFWETGVRLQASKGTMEGVQGKFKDAGSSRGLGPILAPYQKAGKTQEFLTYVMAKKLVYLAERSDNSFEHSLIKDIGPTGLQDTKDYISRNAKWFEEDAGEMKMFMDDLAHYMQRGELLSDTGLEKFLASDAFIPMYRKTLNSFSKTREDISGSSFLKSMDESSQGDVDNLYRNLVRYTKGSIVASDVNAYRLSVIRKLMKHQELGTIKEPIIKQLTSADYGTSFSQPISILKENLKRNGLDLTDEIDGIIKEATEKGTLSDIESNIFFGFSQTPHFEDGSQILIVRDKGDTKLFRIFDPGIADSLTDSGMSTQAFENPILRGVEAGFKSSAGWISQHVVNDPAFYMPLMAADTISSTIKNRFNFIPGISSIQGMKDVLTNQKMLDDFLVHGGSGSFRSSLKNEKILSELKDVSASERFQKDAYKTLYKMASSVGEGVRKLTSWDFKFNEKLAQAAELASRMATFNLALKSGIDPLGAGALSREIVTDFSVKGSAQASKLLNAHNPFFRAATAGLGNFARFMKALSTNPLQYKKSIALLSSYTAFSVGNHEFNSLFQKYRSTEPYLRSSYFFFPVNFDIGETTKWMMAGADPLTEPVIEWFPVRKPLEFQFIDNAFITLREFFRGEGNHNVSQRALEVLGSLSPTANAPISPILSTGLGIFANKDHFGNPIVPNHLKGLHYSEQYKNQTSELSKYIAKITNDTLGTSTNGIYIDLIMDNIFLPGVGQIFKTALENSTHELGFGGIRRAELLLGKRRANPTRSSIDALRDTPLEPIALYAEAYVYSFIKKFRTISSEDLTAPTRRLYELQAKLTEIISEMKSNKDLSAEGITQRTADAYQIDQRYMLNSKDVIPTELDKEFIEAFKIVNVHVDYIGVQNDQLMKIRLDGSLSLEEKKRKQDVVTNEMRKETLSIFTYLEKTPSLADLQDELGGRFTNIDNSSLLGVFEWLTENNTPKKDVDRPDGNF